MAAAVKTDKTPRIGLIAAPALCFLLFVYAPLELCLTNPLEFWFSAAQLLPAALGLFVLGSALLCALLLALRRFAPRLYPLAVAVLFAALVCTWIQGSFLVAGLPGLNGAAVDWNAYPGQRLASALLWLAVSALIVTALRKLGGKRFVTVCAWGSLGLCLMLGVTLVTLSLTGRTGEKEQAVICTDEGLFTYSEDENFLILVLDAVDGDAFEQALARDARYPGIFEDFTYFSDAMGGYPYSHCSIPLLLTGQWYEAQEDFADYERAAMASSPLLTRLEREGWRRWLYPYDAPVTAAAAEGQFENLTADRPQFDSPLSAVKVLIKMALIKHAPWDLKRLGYDLPNRLTEFMAYEGEHGEGYYDWSDLLFYHRVLGENPIVTVAAPCFKYLHLEGAHQPHVYDRDMNVLPDSPYRDVIEGNFRMLETFFARMREAGVWDNTVIVLCSDHGSSNGADLNTINQHTILLVKGRGERHPFRTDAAPISYDDLQTAYDRLLDGAQSDGVFDWRTGDARSRRFLYHELNAWETLTEYIQTGRAADMDTLLPTGRVLEYSR